MVYPTDILGSLLFNINSLDMLFEQKDVKFAAYADDNIPYFINKNLEVLLRIFRYIMAFK